MPLRVCETVYTKSLFKSRNVQFRNGNCDKIWGILHVSDKFASDRVNSAECAAAADPTVADLMNLRYY